MLLAEWRKAEGLTQTAFALRLGVAASTVASWEQRTKIPGPGYVIEIYRLSDGVVGPNDWYDLPALDAPERQAA